MAKSTHNQQIKGSLMNTDERRKAVGRLHDSVQFISDKFKEYDEGWAKKNEIIGNLQSEVSISSSIKT